MPNEDEEKKRMKFENEQRSVEKGKEKDDEKVEKVNKPK